MIREYDLHTGAEAAIEARYGAGGAWVGLLSNHLGYIDTQLLRDARPRRYLTIDRWASATEHTRFLEAASARYARGDTLTLTERCIGRCETPC